MILTKKLYNDRSLYKNVVIMIHFGIEDFNFIRDVFAFLIISTQSVISL